MTENLFTKETENFLKIAFGDYKKRRKEGVLKRRAACFITEDFRQEHFPNLSSQEIKNPIIELSHSGFATSRLQYVSFYLKDEALVYMENKPKEAISEVIDIVSKFIP